MRLLNPKELKNKKDKQQIDLASRGLKIASLVDKENKKLILVKKENKEETERIQKDFNTFIIDTNSKKRELEAKVIKLEIRRKEALEPIDKEQIRLEIIRKEVDDKQIELVNEKKQVEEDRDRNFLRDKVLITKESDASKRDSDLSKLNGSLLTEQKDTKAKTKAFEDRQTEWDKKLSERVSGIDEVEKKLKDRHKALDILEDRNEKQQLEINKDRRHLESQQKTLKSAFDEARLKNLL